MPLKVFDQELDPCSAQVMQAHERADPPATAFSADGRPGYKCDLHAGRLRADQ